MLNLLNSQLPACKLKTFKEIQEKTRTKNIGSPNYDSVQPCGTNYNCNYYDVKLIRLL